jgi:hypothetical protein
MADYYTKLCIKIPLDTAAEVRWWVAVGAAVLPALLDKRDPESDPFVKDFVEKYPKLFELYPEESICNIRFIEESTEEKERFSVIIMDVGMHANIDGIAHILQAYLKEFDCTKPFAFSWSESCDRYRPDGFGGGVCFVTRDEITIQSTFGLIEDWVQKFCVETTANLYDTTPYGIGCVKEEKR